MIRVQQFEGAQELGEVQQDAALFAVVSLAPAEPGLVTQRLKVAATEELSGHVSPITPAVPYLVRGSVALSARPGTWRPSWVLWVTFWGPSFTRVCFINN